MRFNEFKLTEAKSNDFYTVGDSHAKGVGTASRLSAATNLAVDGAAAHGRGRGREMLANIVKIPKGANVLISVGANDTADVVKQNVDSQGKTRLPPVSKIVGDVMKVVNAVKEQSPNKIVFMLFPNGDNKKTKYYAGDYQKEVRDALKSAVGVKVIDYDGSPMQNDGIHYQFDVYKKAGTDARKEFGVPAPVGNPDANPAVVPTKEKPGDTVSNTGSNTQSNTQSNTGSNTASQENKPNLNDPRVAGMFKGNAPKDNDKDITVDLSVGPGKNYYNPKGIKQTSPNTVTPGSDSGSNTTSPVVVAPGTNTNKDPGASNTKPPVVTAPPANQDKKDNNSERIGNLPTIYQRSVTSGQIGQVLDLLASCESNGYYNIVFRKGKVNKRINGLENATIAAVMTFQVELKKQNGARGSDAVGRYQYVGGTLKEMVEIMGLNKTVTRFSPETQDSIATADMRRRCDLDKWLAGSISHIDFLEKLSRVWAGLPCPSKGGKSYHPYDTAQTTLATALDALKKIRERK